MDKETLSSSLSPGEFFRYRGFNWVALDCSKSSVLSMMVNTYDVIPFDNLGRNNWGRSSSRKFLNSHLLKQIGKQNLRKMYVDLVADNGDKSYGICYDYISLITCDQYRKYRDYIPFHEGWIWTCTPDVCSSGNRGEVRLIHYNGKLNEFKSQYSYGIVPVCRFKI